MTPVKKGILIAGFCAVYGIELFFLIRLSTPDGIRLNHPVAGSSITRESVATGDAWMKQGLSRIDVLVTDTAAGTTTVFPATRDTVKYRGAPLFPLSFYRVKISFPADGAYSIRAVAFGMDGRSIETPSKTVEASALARSRAFVFGSPSHLAAIAVIAVISILLPILVRRSRSARLRDRVALVISVVLLAHEVVFQVYWFLMQNWTVANNLTVHMCSLAVMFIPVMFFTENKNTRRYLFEILYFFGLGGALQALFSPDIGLFGYPLLKYFNYFISHGTIIDVFSDIFGPSPRYLVGLELMGIILLALLYLPYPIRRLARRRAKGVRGSVT